MIARDFVKAQIRRLAGLSFPPTTEEAVEELHDAGQNAEREQSLRQAIDDFLMVMTEWPKPADIRRAVAAEDGRKKSWQPAPLDRKELVVCARCAGFLNVLNPETGKYESCACDTALRPSPDGKSTVGRELAESMNRNAAPPPAPEKLKEFANLEDFEATVRRAILARIGAHESSEI